MPTANANSSDPPIYILVALLYNSYFIEQLHLAHIFINKIDIHSFLMLRPVFCFLLLTLAACQYTVAKVENTTTSVTLTLNYTGDQHYYVKPKSTIIQQLVFKFQALTYNQFTFKIYDPNTPRYEVPQGGIFPLDPQANFTYPLSIASYELNYTQTHFAFTIVRRSTKAVIFDSRTVELIFSEYYLQIGTILDSKTLFGYSERFTEHFALKPGTWTVWNKDNGQKIDMGATGTGGIQTHGYYPVYMLRQQQGLHHLGYFRTSNALDVQVQSYSNDSYLKIYRTIGGIIDFRFILGTQDPEALLTTFHTFVGPAIIPPFWSLGFHQCRWGYKNVSALQTVLGKYNQNGIPLDTIWSDIDYMLEYQTFTVDTNRFPLDRMKNITDHYKYIPIIEPSIRYGKGYAYEEGKKRNVFIQSAEGGDQIGKVWAGLTEFVDYFHPNATQYWVDMLERLYSQIQFSGAWIDMNQISNLCDGPCSPPNGTTIIDYTHDIPYHPGGKNIEMVAIPLNATHYGNRKEADHHVFFGMMEGHATHEFMKTKGRPFIISRSHTLGSSSYVFHWTGDNLSNFTFLRLSIGGQFMMSMWGMQMVGSDICGFGGNATEQLCSRFFQLGSLYPFARNHNQDTSLDQQAYALGPVVLESSKKNLKLRYSLLKSYYRQFLIRRGVGTIFRPLYFQFYSDTNLLKDDLLQTQLLIGRSLMSAPIVEQGKTSRQVYFPGEGWFDLHTGKEYQGGSTAVIENQLTDLVPLYLRKGYLTFRQNVDNVLKTDQLDNRFELVAACRKVETTPTFTSYSAQGGLLSLSDYNNNEFIDMCLNEDCDYQLNVILTIDNIYNYKTLTLQTKFKGGFVRNEQRIYLFTLFVEGKEQTISYQPEQDVKIFEEGIINFNFEMTQ